MDIVTWIVGIVLVIGFTMAGAMKLVRNETSMQMAEQLGFTPRQFQMIGAAEVAGALGVLIGLIGGNDDLSNLSGLVGTMAAVGLAVLMLGAAYTHVKRGDEPKETAPSIVMLILAVVFAVLFNLG